MVSRLAILVNGPTGTRVISFGLFSIISFKKVTASISKGFVTGKDKAALP